MDLEVLQALLAQAPWYTDGWHALGHRLMNEQRSEEAIDAYGHAVMLAHRYHPLIHFEHSAIWLQLALLRYRQGEIEKAEDAVEQAIFQDHNNEPALLLRDMGREALATLPPYERHVVRMEDRLQELRRLPLPITVHSDATILYTDAEQPTMRTHDEAMEVWMDTGNADAALPMLDALIGESIEHHLWLLHRGLVRYDAGNISGALQDIERALTARDMSHKRYHRDAAMHYYHRGLAHRAIGEVVLARNDFIRAADIDTGYALPREALHAVENT